MWLTLTGIIALHPKAENPPEFSTEPLPTRSPVQRGTRQPSCVTRGSALGQVFWATLSWGLDCAHGALLVSFAQVGNEVLHWCGHHKLFCTGWGCCCMFVGELRWCPACLGTWKRARRNINQLWSPVNLWHSKSGEEGHGGMWEGMLLTGGRGSRPIMGNFSFHFPRKIVVKGHCSISEPSLT